MSQPGSSVSVAVRLRVSDPACMTDERVAHIAAGLAKRPYCGRQDLYRFLRANKARLAAAFEETDASWRTIADQVGAAGVMGATGNLPTRETIRRVWHRVCRDIAADEAKRLLGTRAGPAARPRAPPGWRPPALAQLDAPPPPASEHQASPPKAERWWGRPEDEPSTAKPGSIEAVREMLNLRSGRRRDGSPLY